MSFLCLIRESSLFCTVDFWQFNKVVEQTNKHEKGWKSSAKIPQISYVWQVEVAVEALPPRSLFLPPQGVCRCQQEKDDEHGQRSCEVAHYLPSGRNKDIECSQFIHSWRDDFSAKEIWCRNMHLKCYILHEFSKGDILFLGILPMIIVSIHRPSPLRHSKPHPENYGGQNDKLNTTKRSNSCTTNGHKRHWIFNYLHKANLTLSLFIGITFTIPLFYSESVYCV